MIGLARLVECSCGVLHIEAPSVRYQELASTGTGDVFPAQASIFAEFGAGANNSEKKQTKGLTFNVV